LGKAKTMVESLAVAAVMPCGNPHSNHGCSAPAVADKIRIPATTLVFKNPILQEGSVHVEPPMAPRGCTSWRSPRTSKPPPARSRCHSPMTMRPWGEPPPPASSRAACASTTTCRSPRLPERMITPILLPSSVRDPHATSGPMEAPHGPHMHYCPSLIGFANSLGAHLPEKPYPRCPRRGGSFNPPPTGAAPSFQVGAHYSVRAPSAGALARTRTVGASLAEQIPAGASLKENAGPSIPGVPPWMAQGGGTGADSTDPRGAVPGLLPFTASLPAEPKHRSLSPVLTASNLRMPPNPGMSPRPQHINRFLRPPWSPSSPSNTRG